MTSPAALTREIAAIEKKIVAKERQLVDVLVAQLSVAATSGERRRLQREIDRLHQRIANPQTTKSHEG